MVEYSSSPTHPTIPQDNEVETEVEAENTVEIDLVENMLPTDLEVEDNLIEIVEDTIEECVFE